MHPCVRVAALRRRNLRCRRRAARALLTADSRIERSGAPITCEIIKVAPVGEKRSHPQGPTPRQQATSVTGTNRNGVTPETGEASVTVVSMDVSAESAESVDEQLLRQLVDGPGLRV
jgi:hypothetical protein